VRMWGADQQGKNRRWAMWQPDWTGLGGTCQWKGQHQVSRYSSWVANQQCEKRDSETWCPRMAWGANRRWKGQRWVMWHPHWLLECSSTARIPRSYNVVSLSGPGMLNDGARSGVGQRGRTSSANQQWKGQR